MITKTSVVILMLFLMCTQQSVASKVVSPGLVELPSQCLKEKIHPCAVQADGRRVKIDLEGFRAVLADQAIVQIISDQQLKIVKGDVYLYRTLQDSVEYEVISEFGSVYLLKEAHLFFKKTAQTLEIYPLESGVQVVPMGYAKSEGLFLPVGYRSHLGSVAESRKAHYEIPVSANLKGLVESWAPLYPGSATELTHFLNQYRTHWLEAAQAGATMQNQWAERELASAKNDEIKKQQMIERAKLEQQQMQKLFRSKNYLE